MVYFHTKNPNLGTFWRAFEWKMLVYRMVILYVLSIFCILNCLLVYYFWFIMPTNVKISTIPTLVDLSRVSNAMQSVHQNGSTYVLCIRRQSL
jgi:hypothetical protein